MTTVLILMKYIYTNIDLDPKLKADIQKKASFVYSNISRKDDKANAVFIVKNGVI